MKRLEFYKKSNDYVHFEFEAGSEQSEVEVYIGGYYLCSVSVDDISEQAKYELFGHEERDVTCFPCIKCGEVYTEESGAEDGFTCDNCKG